MPGCQKRFDVILPTLTYSAWRPNKGRVVVNGLVQDIEGIAAMAAAQALSRPP
jgi:hypothetical protein